MAAAEWGRLRQTSLLLDWGSDIEAKDEEGNMALHLSATGRGYPTENAVALLLTRGANVEARNNDGDTPLIRAALGGTRNRQNAAGPRCFPIGTESKGKYRVGTGTERRRHRGRVSDSKCPQEVTITGQSPLPGGGLFRAFNREMVTFAERLARRPPQPRNFWLFRFLLRPSPVVSFSNRHPSNPSAGPPIFRKSLCPPSIPDELFGTHSYSPDGARLEATW